MKPIEGPEQCGRQMTRARGEDPHGRIRIDIPLPRSGSRSITREPKSPMPASPSIHLAFPLLPALVLILSAAGCGSPAPAKPDLFFSLDPAPLESPTGSPIPATLLVNELAARGFLGGRQIVFRTEEEPLRVQRYDDLLWDEPVPRAMSRNLVNAIRAAEVFQVRLDPRRPRSRGLSARWRGRALRASAAPTSMPSAVAGCRDAQSGRGARRRSPTDPGPQLQPRGRCPGRYAGRHGRGLQPIGGPVGRRCGA
jgi:cholesterol transport system auxiliary component